MLLRVHRDSTRGSSSPKYLGGLALPSVFPALHLPLTRSPLRSSPPLIQLGDLGGSVSSPSGVWGEAPEESNFVHFSLKI